MLSPESQTEEVTTLAGELKQLAQGVKDDVQTIQEKYDQGQLDPGPIAQLRDKAQELFDMVSGMIGERQGIPATDQQVPPEAQQAPPDAQAQPAQAPAPQ